MILITWLNQCCDCIIPLVRINVKFHHVSERSSDFNSLLWWVWTGILHPAESSQVKDPVIAWVVIIMALGPHGIQSD